MVQPGNGFEMSGKAEELAVISGELWIERHNEMRRNRTIKQALCFFTTPVNTKPR
jgi:hypothetical protein